MYKHILIATDRSEYSNKVVADGIALAKAIGARITIYTAILPRIGAEYALVSDSSDTANYGRIIEAHAAAVLEAAQAQADAAGVPCTTLSTKHEQPWRAILDSAAAQNCDMIMMASHGRSGLDALLLGSEAQKVLTHSTIPVLVDR